MLLPIFASFLYGSLALLGGILGYQKAKSLPSLISGLISGLLLIISGIMQLQGITIGKPLAIGISVLLLLVFLIRLQKTKRFMPAGLMVLVGVVSLGMLLTPNS